MSILSTFYDSSAGTPASLVTEVKWAKAHPHIGSSEYGVDGVADFKVTAHPSTPYAVNVAAGKAWGHGVLDESDGVVTVVCDAPAVGVTRWDLISIRRDWTPLAGGPTSVTKVAGGSSKEIPAARENTPGTLDDQPLYLVKWVGGQTQPVELVDLRCWAGNGGVFAKDDLVRTYLNRVGTEVNINGASWIRRLGANDIPEWVKGSSTRVVNASLNDLNAITGLTAVTTNNNGDVSIPVPAFLTSVANVILTDATTSVGGPVLLKWTPATTGTTVITCRAFGTNGSPLPGYNLSISWTMFGQA